MSSKLPDDYKPPETPDLPVLHTNREAWLIEATALLRERVFARPAWAVPKQLHVSCGIPAGSSRAIGQCWDSKLDSGGRHQIFICPSIDDQILVLGTLAHELVHAVVGIQAQHGPDFKRVAEGIGLTGKMTATVVEPESLLHDTLLSIGETLGAYPHTRLKKTKAGLKRPTVKRVKLFDPSNPEYNFSVPADLLEDAGPPLTPHGVKMVPKSELRY